jgi:alkylhydroperoxidase family enzyme
LVQAWREAGSLFDTRERSALAWAETVTRVADTAVPDADFHAASAVFSDKELADLTIANGLERLQPVGHRISGSAEGRTF